MSPEGRIKLIRGCIPKLLKYELPELNLILREFGITWGISEMDDDPKSTAFYRLGEEEDRKILALSNFLNSDKKSDEPPTVSDLNAPWQPQRSRLFISHKHEDWKLATELKQSFAEYGIDGFVAHMDIKPTKEWQDEIVKALDSCDVIVPLLTPNFKNSDWADQEVGYCVGRRVKILSLSFGLTPYGLMGRYQAMKCSKKASTATIAKKVFDILIEDELVGLKITTGLVGLFEETTGYPELIKLSLIMQNDVKYWTPELLRRLDEQLKTDVNVQNAWYVPARLRAIIEQNTRT